MSVRIDKWLWHARFFKTRALAHSAASSGHIRLNGFRVEKAHQAIKPGDVLTVARSREVLVVRVRGEAIRRGPAREAQALYEIVDETPLDRGTDAP
ncbi:MAG TPA: RNA-binding S4 domain-containing protein [Rhizomicrobium sp.]|jgi:ribosome-associated heat shock protein Hsp15|nr:RNA-binding S4 domain-containing protein [Rhizomicrobium sp.]